MRFRKPETIPLLFIIAATLLLSGLGVWQLQRLHWKEGLIRQMESAQALPALGNLPPGDIGTFAYRNAVLTGSYIKNKALRFVGHETGGYVWYVPLKLDDSDITLLVKLPWLPSGKKPEFIAGTQPVSGILRPAWPPRMFSPANRPRLNVWFTEDMPEISRETHLRLAPLVLDTTGTPTFRNDHLGYAITWFSLALIGLVMFGIYYRESADKR